MISLGGVQSPALIYPKPKKTKMNSFIATQIKEIATELILDALENGDAIKTAEDLKVEIIAGWDAALIAAGVPAEYRKALQL